MYLQSLCLQAARRPWPNAKTTVNKVGALAVGFLRALPAKTIVNKVGALAFGFLLVLWASLQPTCNAGAYAAGICTAGIYIAVERTAAPPSR